MRHHFRVFPPASSKNAHKACVRYDTSTMGHDIVSREQRRRRCYCNLAAAQVCMHAHARTALSRETEDKSQMKSLVCPHPDRPKDRTVGCYEPPSTTGRRRPTSCVLPPPYTHQFSTFGSHWVREAHGPTTSIDPPALSFHPR